MKESLKSTDSVIATLWGYEELNFKNQKLKITDSHENEAEWKWGYDHFEFQHRFKIERLIRKTTAS